MSEPGTNKRQTIDITEFERRLRGTGPAAGAREDPLAELARLVNSDRDPFQSVFGAAPAPARTQPQAAPSPVTPDWRKREARFEDFLDDAPGAASPAAGLAGSRGTFDPNAESHVAATHAAGDSHEAGFDGQFGEDESGPWLEDDGAAGIADIDTVEPPRRSSRALIFVAAGLVIVLGGIGGTFAFRHTAFMAGTPPTIVADSAPVKVKPPVSANAQDSSAPAVSLLDRDGSGNGPSHVVNSVEQPIDFAQTPIAQRINVAGAAPGPSANGPVSIFPITKRVKTFSVRPDGTIIDPNGAPGQEASAAAPVSPAQLFSPQSAAPSQIAQMPAVQASVAQAAPAIAAAPMPQARPSTLPAVANDTTATIPAATATTATRRQTATRTPARVIAPKVESAQADAAAPLQLGSAASADRTTPRSTRTSAAPDPFQIAAAEPDPAPVAAVGGSYTLQLAAPFTEAEAHTTWARLQSKYPTELGSLEPSIRAADNNGHHFYRLRTSGMAASEANALCVKLKAEGGSCFVTKN